METQVTQATVDSDLNCMVTFEIPENIREKLINITPFNFSQKQANCELVNPSPEVLMTLMQKK